MRYLEIVEVLAIIDELGLRIKDVSLIESALQRPAASMFGVEQYVSVHEKGAAMLHSLIKNHPMHDGNKRVAWVLTRLFMAQNGCSYLRPPDADVFDYLVNEIAASQSIGIEEIADRLRRWFAEESS